MAQKQLKDGKLRFIGKAVFMGFASYQRSATCPFESRCALFSINGVEYRWYGTDEALCDIERLRIEKTYDIKAIVTQDRTLQRVKY